MIDENGSVFQPIDQSDMIARIESFDVDEDDHSFVGPKPSDPVVASSVAPVPTPAPAPPAPGADVAPAPPPAPSPAPPAPSPGADVAPARAQVALELAAIMESGPVFREEDPALVYRTHFILGGPEATIARPAVDDRKDRVRLPAAQSVSDK